MEMIWHKTPCQNIGKRANVSSYFLKEEQIILPTEENYLGIITPIINVVEIFWFKLHIQVTLIMCLKVINLSELVTISHQLT